ncbi:hypothetical protein [Corynebacterium tapiri]|uniref:hypothetical protein n=1 Tax=Corynebacterium tapiri TaxID=1448266 RepID=UPI0015D58510|nr:hypothetical protein [Corynebacterium tapiri]
MIEVSALNINDELVSVKFETNAVEVIDGALIVYTEGAKNFIAGFAPGQWFSFHNLAAH